MSGLTGRKWAAALAAGAILLTSAGVSPAAARSISSTASSAAPVLDWSRLATQAVVAGRPPASSQVLLGIVHVAIADAVSGLGYGQPFLIDLPTDRKASASAAVATAAYDVLRVRVPGQQAFLDSAYDEYLAGTKDGDAKARGVRLGRTVAAAVLAWRADDGMANQVPYLQPPVGPGVWEPTAPTPPVDLVLTQVKPLALRSSTQFQPAGPDPLTSRRYARDVAEVAALGRIDSAVRTAAQTETAMFWSAHAPQQWSQALVALAEAERLSLGAAAQLLVRAQVSAADSLITCWVAKFHFSSWRPVHAIQRAGTDGNPATSADPTWNSLLAANHPEYPSGHSCITSAMTSALRIFFWTDRVPLSFSSQATGTSRGYERLSAVTADVREARILSGLHLRHAMLDGELLGAGVSLWVAGHFRAAR